MDRRGIDKAKDRLATATECAGWFIDVRKHPTTFNYSDARRRWSGFILAFNGIFTALEQASKDTPRSRFWMGTRKNERRNDQLLSYLQHARNSDEHGISPVLNQENGRVVFEDDQGDSAVIDNFDGKYGVLRSVRKSAASEIYLANTRKLKIFPGKPALVAVADRGVSYSVPLVHLGAAIKSAEPAEVAALALSYARRMIAEAETL